jgi:DNA (cytosine-5)-methyltransferase 1
MNEKTHLDLFSGIGGFALAAKWNGYRTVGFCDNEPYAQAVLKKHWPEVPCHKDIREVRGKLYAGVTLLTGGFPCQPFSVAGKQRGKDDNRYLWPEMLRVIQEARPAWIIGENVAGIVNLALDQVCADLEGQGYEVEPIIVPACAVDAPHRRDRVWIVGHSKLDGLTASKTSGGLLDQSEEQRGKVKEWESSGASCASSDVADSVSLSERSAHGSKEWGCVRGRQDEDISQRDEVGGNSSDSRENVADSVKQGWEGRVHRREDAERESVDGYSGCGGTTYGQSGEAIWLAEPNVGRVANGIPNRTHRLKGLGNAIVPQVASEIIRCINKIMEDNK